jgi:hypothetical protein
MTQKKPVRFGRLRERVKSGEFDAKDALCFAIANNASEALIKWLSRFNLQTHNERAQAEKERKAKSPN